MPLSELEEAGMKVVVKEEGEGMAQARVGLVQD